MAAWHESHTQQDSLAFPGQPELVGLFWLLDYWDHLARAAHHVLAAGLAQVRCCLLYFGWIGIL